MRGMKNETSKNEQTPVQKAIQQNRLTYTSKKYATLSNARWLPSLNKTQVI